VLPDRGDAADSFTRALDQHLAASDDEVAPTVAAVLAALTGREVPAVADGPGWISALGNVRLTGAYAYGDRYGDQTSYVVTFAYEDETLGGPEHAVVVLADHNLGMAKDIFVAAPAADMIATLRDGATDDEATMSWFAEIAPSTVRAAADAYLKCTDMAAELPEGESLPANRALTLARIALLPAPEPTDAAAAGATSAGPPNAESERLAAVRTRLIEDFLASPEADLAGLADRTGGERESLTYCLALIVDFATGRGDAMRWSPAGVETFLTSWVHERAILDADDAALLPDALRAWIAWAGRRVDLPTAALAETLTAVRSIREEFARLYETGERLSPASRAMAAMIADGVDLTDPAAVEVWLANYTAVDQ
jgi:hypothetical protein